MTKSGTTLERLVCIQSHVRSGSTLLGALLGSQPAVCFIGEAHWLAQRENVYGRCSCGRMVAECAFWSQICNAPGTHSFTRRRQLSDSAKRVLQGIMAIPVSARTLRWLGQSAGLLGAEVRSLEGFVGVAQAASAASGRPVICDGTKHTFHARGLSLLEPGVVRILHLVRDGRGVAHSIRRRFGGDVGTIARRWALSNVYAWVSHFGLGKGRVLRVHYEDLVRDPGLEIARIGHFLGFETVSLPPRVDITRMHFLGGSPTVRREFALHVRSDENWRDEMNAADLRAFERNAGWVNRWYGYTR